MSRRLLALAVVAAMVPASAHAEDPPWSRGVTAAQKATAQQLLEAGNTLFLANNHKDALARYTDAIAAWDHPAIRFNMVRALIALDRPLEAFENLEKALAYGAQPLEDQVYQEALNYERLLRRQVSTVELSCTQRGATVQFDGDVTLACPARQRVRRLLGKHRLIGTGSGFEPESREIVLSDAAPLAVEVTLAPARISRGPRFARWKPWAVVVGGAVVAGTGLVLNRIAHKTADDVDRQSQRVCPDGCTAEVYAAAGLDALEDKVDRYNTLSTAGLAVGGATLLLGGALVLLNRDVYERAIVDVKPGGATVGARFRF